ncbi:TetR/AcrR family transcriptional regulator [Rhodococcus sp. OK302]|uniref:TetR/AcrR family transcriptional regulator n=1 Tax=Rhodococcus sp. OK302 TaxID=1882769 RepID=UPI000B9458BF|nr:TetR/AcrR family transcriptional regulator [Rhodococcus sp. OK302]
MSMELMNAGQLERRHRLTCTVIDMLTQIPSDRIQMKDVSERSGVALGTLYRYFPKKQQLLAAAMVEWSGLHVERRVVQEDPRMCNLNVRERVLHLHRREMKAFQRRPNFARLEIELHSSADEFVIETLDQRAAAHRTVMFELMDGVPAEVARITSLAVGGTMVTALALWSSGRIGFAEAQRNVEDVISLVLRD